MYECEMNIKLSVSLPLPHMIIVCQQ